MKRKSNFRLTASKLIHRNFGVEIVSEVTMRNVLSSLLFLVAGSPAMAFTPSECSALLKYGIFDQFDTITSEEKLRNFKSEYCKQTSSEAGITVPIKAVPVTGNYSSQEQYCNNTSDFQLQTYFNSVIEKTVSKTLVDGFTQCLSASNPGLTYILRTKSNPADFSVRFTYVPYVGNATAKASILVKGASCVSASLPGKTIQNSEVVQIDVTAGAEMICSREPSHSVQITAHFNNNQAKVNTESIELPAYRVPPKPPQNFIFNNPGVDGTALDICAQNSSSCDLNQRGGRPAADIWCSQLGLGLSYNTQIQEHTPPTKIITSKDECTTPACTRISQITCANPAYPG